MRTARTQLVISAAVLGLAGSALAVPAANAATLTYVSTGSAYTANTGAKSILAAGTVGNVSLGCGIAAGTKTNAVAATSLSTAGRVGAATSTVTASGSGDNRKTTSIATSGAVDLLGGVIKAEAITATAVSAHSTTGFTESASSKITNLFVAGRPVAVSSKPDTKISLPLIGSVVINQQTRSAASHRVTVNALTISLLPGNNLGLPATTLTVGHAGAALSDPINRRVYGGAQAGRVTLADGTVVSPPVDSISIPCTGTGGTKLTRTTAAVTAGTLALTGTGSSTAVSKDSATQTTATTSNTIQGANLLGGVVKLGAVTAKATATRTGSALTTSAAGTTIASLTVNGKPVPINTKQNNKIDLAGIGTLWTRKVAKSSSGITVRAVELDLLTAQAGLKAGSVVIVGQASAGVYAS